MPVDLIINQLTFDKLTAGRFWTTERVKAFLSAVPIGSMLILDLYSDEVSRLFSSFFTAARACHAVVIIFFFTTAR